MTFEYIRAYSTDEALRLLIAHGSEARLLAGGTDLLLAVRDGRARPKYVIDLNHVAELTGIEPTETGLRIGAMTSMRALGVSPQLAGGYRVLAEAARTVASVQIRNLATVGGNICNASPSADTAPALMVLGAEAEIVGPQGSERLPLEQFFQGPGQTALAANQMLVALHLPRPAEKSGAVYIKHSLRRAMDLAFVGVACLLSAANGQNGRIETARIALGAVAPTPIRARRAEELIRSRGQLDEETIAEAAKLAADTATPIDDVRATAWYRKRMVEVETGRALRRAGEAIAS